MNEKKMRVTKKTINELIKYQEWAMESIPPASTSDTRTHVKNSLVILYALKTFLNKKT